MKKLLITTIAIIVGSCSLLLNNHMKNDSLTTIPKVNIKIEADGKTASASYNVRMYYKSYDHSGNLINLTTDEFFAAGKLQTIYVAQAYIGYIQAKIIEAARSAKLMTITNKESRDAIGNLDWKLKDYTPTIFAWGNIISSHVNLWPDHRTGASENYKQIGYWY